VAQIINQKKKKQEESDRDGDVLGGVNALASARSLINGGRGQDEEKASQSSPGAMQVDCKQIECKIISIKQKSNELRTRSGAKD
jgi:hypothetical protein